MHASRRLMVGLLSAAFAAGCGGKTGDTQADAGPVWDAAPNGACAVTLPQAVTGAMWANPESYPRIPLRAAVQGVSTAMEVVVVGSASPIAGQRTGDGSWLAQLPIDALAAGVHELTVAVTCSNGDVEAVTADLGVGSEGIQHTVFADVGVATSPRIHRRGAELWLSWTGTYDGDREGWMQQIDGAGRPLGDRILTTPSTGDASNPDPDSLYAWTAMGASSVAVLYQEPGQPYDIKMRVIDLTGSERLPPVALVPPGWRGRPRGDIGYDGSGFVLAYRVMDASGASDIHWLRVDEERLTITGPVVVASNTDASPVGGFESFMYMKVAGQPGVSMVSYVRDYYNHWLGLEIPNSEVATLLDDGTLVGSTFCTPELDFTWHWESRVARLGDGFFAYWDLNNLQDPALNPPAILAGARADADGVLDPERPNMGTVIIEEPNDRQEPIFVETPLGAGVLAWIDVRDAETNPGATWQLYAAPVNDDLTGGAQVRFSHARFFAAASDIHGAAVGTNVILTWRDNRSSIGMNLKPEIFLETLWY